LLARDNTSDPTTRINDMIVGRYASVGTTIPEKPYCI
jgi:hypothetical protein